jgi:hypothetical protein
MFRPIIKIKGLPRILRKTRPACHSDESQNPPMAIEIIG